MRDWKTGDVDVEYNLHDYEETWGNVRLLREAEGRAAFADFVFGKVYNMFHRQDIHRALLNAAVSPEGEGTPTECVIDHVCKSVDYENGIVTFVNGVTASGDLIIGGDGIRVCGHLSRQHRHIADILNT
jgi:salicylate hydroxylase